MNNFKLRQRKMPTILKLGAIALFGACMCVPCLKYQDVDKKVFIPPILKYDINLRVCDDVNIGVIIRDITYNNVDGTYALGYSIPMPILSPYQAYFNGYIEFTYGPDSNASFGRDWFTSVSISNEQGIEERYNAINGRLIIDADSPSSTPFNWSISPSQNDIGLFVGYDTGSDSTFMRHTLLDVDLDVSDYPNLVGLSRSGGYLLNAPLLLGSNPSSYQQGVSYGIQYVLDHLTDYNLYNQSEYLAYGASEYQRGFNASNDVLSIAGFVHEIFKSPVTMFKDIFNWSLPLPNGEVINMLPLMTFLLTIGIALAVVNLILKIK